MLSLVSVILFREGRVGYILLRFYPGRSGPGGGGVGTSCPWGRGREKGHSRGMGRRKWSTSCPAALWVGATGGGIGYTK